MSRTRVTWRAAGWLTLGLVLGTGPAGALTFSIDAQIDQQVQARLGSGLIHGSECSGDPSCEASETSQSLDTTSLPYLSGVSTVNLSTTVGANSVGARASAGAYVVDMQDPMFADPYEPERILSMSFLTNVILRDSESAMFHTPAAASVSSDDFFQLSIPAVRAGDSLRMTVVFTSVRDDFTTVFDGSFRVEDITDGTLLASYDTHSQPGLTEFDLAGLAGHEIRFSMAADVTMSAEAGFGGGNDPLPQRSFISSMLASVNVFHVPEPTSALLVGFGLATLAWFGRRRPMTEAA